MSVRKIIRKIKVNKYPKDQPVVLSETIVRHTIQISPSNRITYIYKISKTGKVIEVTCVSLDINIKRRWVTIVWYDSSHDGRLHRDGRVSIGDESKITQYEGVRKRGTQRRLLRWAIDDLRRNWLIYKSSFLKRNRSLLSDDVDIY